MAIKNLFILNRNQVLLKLPQLSNSFQLVLNHDQSGDMFYSNISNREFMAKELFLAEWQISDFILRNFEKKSGQVITAMRSNFHQPTYRVGGI